MGVGHRAVAALATCTLLVGAGLSCAPLTDAPRWWDQPQASGVCYQVDLGDGLETEDFEETELLFACLNQRGQLDALQPTLMALGSHKTRRGEVAGLELLRAGAQLTDHEVDPFYVFDVLLDAIRSDGGDRPVDDLLDVALELAYGLPAPQVRAAVSLTSPEALEAGVLVPARGLLRPAATLLLDDQLRAANFLSELLAGDETRRWIRSVDAWGQASHPDVSEPVDDLVQHLGEAVWLARSPDNDRWAEASGDSLHDVLTTFTEAPDGEDPLLVRLGPQALSILDDEAVRTELERSLLAQYSSGQLGLVPDQLAWLATSDVQGRALPPGEPSALQRFARLIANTNHPTYCELDLWITSLKIDLPNLAVAILRLLSRMDPDNVKSGLGLLSDIVGSDIGDVILHEAVDLGVCPDLTHEVVDDLEAIDAMALPEAEALLEFFLELMRVLDQGDRDQIPVFADTVEIIYDAGAYPPVEELIVDLGPSDALADVMVLLPAFSEPERYGITAGDEPAVGFQDVLGVLTWVWREDRSGRTGWERMEPLLPLLERDDTWVVLGRVGSLLANDSTKTSQLLDIFHTLLQLDPDMVMLDQVGPMLGDRDLSRPLLEVLEASGGHSGSLLASRPQGEHDEVPIAFAARLIRDGTLEELLQVVDIVLDSLSGS